MGMRISEILGLRWRSVGLERGLVQVEERSYRGELAAPKTGRSLRLLTLGELLGAYRRMKPADARPEGCVFEKDGKPLDERELLRNRLRPAADRLGSDFQAAQCGGEYPSVPLRLVKESRYYLTLAKALGCGVVSGSSQLLLKRSASCWRPIRGPF